MVTELNPSAFPPFEGFQKIARLKRDCIITEKIDGTNAQVFITDDGNSIAFASRTRWLSHGNDNAGFRAWGMANMDELIKLGPGHHFGEWWGSGIQRRYDLKDGEKRFSLFNTGRWAGGNFIPPACCGVVPVLYHGPFSTEIVDTVLENLRRFGSVAADGFMRPEGIVVFLPQAKALFKVTLDDDALPKSLADKERSMAIIDAPVL